MKPVALVTGSSGGIGAAVATRLAADGNTVVGIDQATAAVDQSAEVVRSYPVDVSDEPAIETVVAAVEDEIGPITTLVHAAGLLRAGPLWDAVAADFQELLRVNAIGVDVVSRVVIRRMRDRGAGSIVTISSNAGGVPRIGMAAYGASKAAATAYTKSLGLEVAQFGIRCNVVSPGTTQTPMLTILNPNVDSDGDGNVDAVVARAIQGDPKAFKVGIPLGRVAQPTDIADAVAFLVSDQARHITMHELHVDGGATLR